MCLPSDAARGQVNLPSAFRPRHPKDEHHWLTTGLRSPSSLELSCFAGYEMSLSLRIWALAQHTAHCLLVPTPSSPGRWQGEVAASTTPEPLAWPFLLDPFLIPRQCLTSKYSKMSSFWLYVKGRQCEKHGNSAFTVRRQKRMWFPAPFPGFIHSRSPAHRIVLLHSR